MRWRRSLLSSLGAVFAWLGSAFVERWGRLERFYRRPFARIALRLGFLFYPLLALCALGWLGWDWTHDRNLDAAEDAVFDQVIKLRPWEPKPSGRVVVVEIDDCSIAREGPWPWSRQQHADLLDALDRAGVRTVGYDVLFAEASRTDAVGDDTLEATAEGGNGRFVFGSTRAPEAFADAPGARPVDHAPNAFPIAADPQRPGPRVALLLPYGKAMTRHSALLDMTRDADGIIRDVPLRAEQGDWALPSLALQVASAASGRSAASFPASVRVNWRSNADDRLPYVSAADLIEGKAVCRDKHEALPDLRGRSVLVGYTAAGLNDAKPTPVNAATPGVEIHAEATEALLADSAIWMPPTGFKYLLAAVLVALTGLFFFHGEPAWELDAIFVASNLVLIGAAWVGLTAFGVFLDIFAALGFVSLCFGLCRLYAATQRGRAIGNDDYRPQFDPADHRWLALARLRFVPDPDLDRDALRRRLREYRRRLRRFLYRGTEAVALEGIVEYKSWLWEAMNDVTVLVWGGDDRAAVAATAERELRALHAYLSGLDDVLPDDGSVRVASLISEAVAADETIAQTRARVCAVLGRLLHRHDERSLSLHDAFAADEPPAHRHSHRSPHPAHAGPAAAPNPLSE
ncbi:MAG: CHASE2 domain-containing protein [Lysobacter sp.]|nr:CHASE2 domain-containing protein [Lysobacter sp.]